MKLKTFGIFKCRYHVLDTMHEFECYVQIDSTNADHSTYGHTGYDATNYFQSEVIAKKMLKIPTLMASGGISQERFKARIAKFYALI